MLCKKSILYSLRRFPSNKALPNVHYKRSTYFNAAFKINKIDVVCDKPRDFREIPCVSRLRILKDMFKLAIDPNGSNEKSWDTVLQNLYKDYGKIVYFKGILNHEPIVFLFDADMIKNLYQQQGKRPIRLALQTLHYYNDLRKTKNGLATSQGEEWQKFRSSVNKPMMHMKTVHHHIPEIDEITIDFIDRMNAIRNPKTLELPESFNLELNKWSLESICFIALNHRFGSFKSDDSLDSETIIMLKNVRDMFQLFYEIEVLPSLWRYYNTRNLKRLTECLDTITEIARKHIRVAMERTKNNPDKPRLSVLDYLLTINEETAVTMANDMLLAGIDTTSNTVAKTLYLLATHPRVQKKLITEIDAVIPQIDTPITVDTLNKIPYLKACIKESLRLLPIALGIVRTTSDEIVISGYRIPKRMNVLSLHSATYKDENLFPRAKEFLPERWMKDDENGGISKKPNPFAFMPFGFGVRSCIGRRFANMEMEIIIARIFKRFTLKWHNEPLKIDNRFVNIVSSPLKFKLLDR